MISHDDLELLQKSLPNMSEKDRQRSLTLLKQYQQDLVQKQGKAKFLDLLSTSIPTTK